MFTRFSNKVYLFNVYVAFTASVYIQGGVYTVKSIIWTWCLVGLEFSPWRKSLLRCGGSVFEPEKRALSKFHWGETEPRFIKKKKEKKRKTVPDWCFLQRTRSDITTRWSPSLGGLRADCLTLHAVTVIRERADLLRCVMRSTYPREPPQNWHSFVSAREKGERERGVEWRGEVTHIHPSTRAHARFSGAPRC